jgi:uncharacterized protein (TIGR02246 family)
VSDETTGRAEVADVRQTYDRLMAAFARGATEEYFACFHPDASFFFPGEGKLEGRSAYRAAWEQWQDEGVRFTDVVATDVRVRIIGAAAIVTHRIETTVITDGNTNVERERESIVFARDRDRWVVVHEHLSADE